MLHQTYAPVCIIIFAMRTKFDLTMFPDTPDIYFTT